MVITLRPNETPAQAIRRLAEKARATGVCVFEYPFTGEWYANSRSEANRLHRVTLLSCDCLGFQRYQRCSHHSALLDHLGQLPTDPEPTPALSTYARFRLIEGRIDADDNPGLLSALTYALIDAPEQFVDMDHVWPEDAIMDYLALGPSISAEDLVDFLHWHRDQCRAVDAVMLAA